MSEPKYRHRIPPCAPYDIPAMESWLEDLAAKGLHLSQDGFFMGVAVFEEGPPRKERFRLEATATNGGLLSEEYAPDDDAFQLNHQMGWAYRARRGQFHIYSTADPDAPELNTDPQVQAMTLEALSRYLRKSLRGTLFLAVLYAFLYFGDILITGAIVFGTGKVLLLIALVLWDLGRQIKALVVLSRYCKKLKNGEPLPHRADYRPRAWLHPVLNGLQAVLWVFLLGAFLVFAGKAVTDEDRIALEDYADPFPFATLEDLYPGAEVERMHGILDSDAITWTDFLATANYDYTEYAELTLDGECFDCYLTVNYHETRWEWTADMLAREFVSQSGANFAEQTAAKLFGDEPVIVTGLSVPEADYAVSFFKNRDEPTLVLRKGNIVLRVNLDVLGGRHGFDPEALAQLLLSHLR